MRYHLVSTAAALLALAVGVVLGSTTLSRPLLAGLNDDNSELGHQVATLERERNGLAARLDEADAFAAGIGPVAVRGVLAQRSVVLVSAADARIADREALKRLLAASGAEVAGEVQLTDAFGDEARADQLKEITTRLLPAGVQLPMAADPGALAGGLLGPLLLAGPDGRPQATPQESAAALAGLADGGFVRASPDLRPAQLALVLTGGGARGGGAGDRAAVLARFAAQVDRSGAGVVLAGSAGSADGKGAVGVARADAASTAVLSTVDNVDTPAGRVVAVLALAEQALGRAGRYGTAGNAASIAPDSPVQ